MFEDNSYEPIAEIYITLSDQPNFDDIYCLCSRVFVEGTNVRGEEEAQDDPTVRFSESHSLQTPKKSNDEAVSCYCSASHYSTDEHDSLRESSVLHHSDSGADLSESSRDHDWEKYWTLNGERLIWESWISKYGSYIDPSYISTQAPADGDETSFCVQGDKFPDPNRITSFSGLLESVKVVNNKYKSLDCQQSSVDGDKPDELSAPQILVENVKSDIEEFLNRRLSDISETGKSLSGRSEDSSNFDDNDRLRLSVISRCSGSSAPLSATTDSMTNVTRITLSSSDSSYGIEDSSGKSSSVLSSSDSGSSVDQQWQSLWADHFNEQYYFYYNKFTEKYNKKRDCGEDLKSDSGFIVDDSKMSNVPLSEPQHQESIDDVGSIETQDSVSEGEHSKPPSVTGSSKSSSKSEKAKFTHKQRLLSVGYLLQQLNAMSVVPSEKIQEEDESVNSTSRPSTMESVRNVNVRGDQCCQMDEGANVRHGVKRSYENEINESSIEKVKSAYQLMGFMYDMENTKKIRKAAVWYKKRFSQIRFQNRILRMHKAQNKHIYFDDDGEVCSEPSSQLRDTSSGDKNESGESIFLDAPDISTPQVEQETHEQRKLDMEDFSEKDDSTDDDQDVFFSAEEDNLLDSSQERRENILKALPKRRKKRQLKKKSINYPDVMIANPKIKKFWHRRYSLFSKYDEGIKLDEESWYSVTPEPIATVIAERCRCDLVVDAFCGAGGNAIQLAFTCERVIAVDIDPHKIELARHNAQVYGVEDRIEFVTGDFLELAPTLVADVVFMSPPWGGLSYSKRAVYPFSSLLPVGGQQLYQLASAVTDNVVFYLPKNINTQEVVECAGPGGCVELVQNFHDRELVAITAYFGELVNSDD